MRLRVLATFGLFEAAMPIIGLLIGNDLATSVAGKAHWIGAAVLVALGCYGIVSFVRRIIRTARARQAPGPVVSGPAGSGPVVPGRSGRRQEWIKVAVSAFALSLDNLIAGFALGSYQVNLVVGALVFGVVSVVMSLVGLEFGARLGGWAGDSGDMIGGIVLVGVGLAIGFGVLG
jgi:putative Mn2+ efflux pump MntP